MPLQWKIYRAARVYLIAWSAITAIALFVIFLTSFIFMRAYMDYTSFAYGFACLAVLAASIFKPPVILKQALSNMEDFSQNASKKEKIIFIIGFCVLSLFIGWIIILLLLVFFPLGNFGWAFAGEKYFDISVIAAFLCAIFICIQDIFLIGRILYGYFYEVYEE